MAIWTPDLSGRSGPRYLQIVEALSEDIASGRLRLGDRLPPHRDLAYRLALSPNTTSRAFVRGPAAAIQAVPTASLHRPHSGPIDLSRNLPPPGLAGDKLAQTCAELGRSSGLAALTDYQTEAEVERHAKAAGSWLRRHGVASGDDETLVTAGAQHAIFCTLMALAGPGDLLLTEELTYQPVRPMAARLGLKTAAIASDGEGPCPDDLERLCRQRQVKALYLTPTLQTPTGLTMPFERRRAIAGIVARHGVHLIEDDVFGLFHPERPPPIATLAPDLTVFITSVSKYLAPGLRVGFVHTPPRLASLIRSAVNLTCWMTPPLTAEIVSRWIDDGTADDLIARHRAAASHRHGLARRILGAETVGDRPAGLHLWLDLPAGWSADLFAARAAERNVLVTHGATFAMAPRAGAGSVRVCLGHEADIERLETGLWVLRALLDAGSTEAPLIL